MRPRNRKDVAVEVIVTEYPNPLEDGKTVQDVCETSGLVKFTSHRFLGDYPSNVRSLTDSIDRVGLCWQSYSELRADHGHAIVYRVLLNDDHHEWYRRTEAELLSDISERLSPTALKALISCLENLDDAKDDSGHRRIFLRASWVELFSEKFSDLWLAAVAQHAYYIEEDDFAFGYLTCLLSQIWESEDHFLRGKNVAKSAGKGGLVKSFGFRPLRESILAEMQRLISRGSTRANAARMTFQRGLGTSESANAKLWDRHAKSRDSARQSP